MFRQDIRVSIPNKGFEKQVVIVFKNGQVWNISSTQRTGKICDLAKTLRVKGMTTFGHNRVFIVHRVFQADATLRIHFHPNQWLVYSIIRRSLGWNMSNDWKFGYTRFDWKQHREFKIYSVFFNKKLNVSSMIPFTKDVGTPWTFSTHFRVLPFIV